MEIKTLLLILIGICYTGFGLTINFIAEVYRPSKNPVNSVSKFIAFALWPLIYLIYFFGKFTSHK